MLKQTNAISNGLIIFLLIGVYFILLELLGLTDNFYLRFFNFVFVFYGVNSTLKKATRNSKPYIQKLLAGVTTAFTGIILSALSLFIYLIVFDPKISAYGVTLIPADTDLAFAAVIFVEGFTSSLMVVFILLQYWKNEVTSTADSKV
jgi:hypothetical protein